ncbi:hypothetical protein PVL29_016733 [Vitis rotundifolia]|uniref:Uncharacterized protein n=1 Tax=Vitis rotundifolia TaxID=103349 RepID=A0AA39DI43_VITRO|nr:hypothetical protein PVL29_016730 [Vitis rotundifolia]KAJ9684415.1 hypothetical protein PVL29_016733 [Vitis rotundifolia]
MDVPEMILYETTLVSPGTPVKLEASVHAARMSTPGAAMSGCTTESKQAAAMGKLKEYSVLPSFGITVPTAPALNAPNPILNSSQSTILPVTRDLSKESS